MNNQNMAGEEGAVRASILDTILGAEQLSQLQNFDPQSIVRNMFEVLDERSRLILRRRYGLEGAEGATLEAIGQELNLTRERIRQIEKESLKKLRERKVHPQLVAAHELLTNVLNEHGSVMHESDMVSTLLMSGRTSQQESAVVFILELEESFEKLRHDDYHPSWYLRGFDLSLLHEMIDEMTEVLDTEAATMNDDELLHKVKQRPHYQKKQPFYNEKALRNYITISKKIKYNPFGHVGLSAWTSISPKDVGDKAFLVMKHHNKPEHYSKITELINNAKFDNKTAYKETVHNELIKDQRFVLVGRGIYALTEWGYKPGVVAEIIIEVLNKAGQPLTKDQIIDEVLKQRLVKKNTILVGLSNRKRFAKVGKDKYALAS